MDLCLELSVAFGHGQTHREAPMVPDDIVKPPHISIPSSQLAPQERPAELTDDVWDLIKECAADAPDSNAMEIHECLTKGACSGKKVRQGQGLISLPMVLFVAKQLNYSRSSRLDPRGRS